MFSKALSEQSCVREGVGYDEVYPSGQGDPDSSYLERNSSANSSSEEEDEDLDEEGQGVMWMKFQATRRATSLHLESLLAPKALGTSSSP